MSKKNEFDLYAEKRKILKEKRKLRNKIIGNDEVDGSTFQRVYGEKTKTRRALKIEMFGSKSKSSNYGDDTSIEKFVYDLLNEWDIKFIPQKTIRYINVDAFLPEYNLVIQTNGEYWHCDPRFYPEPKNNIQRKNIEKDVISNKFIEEAGYHLIEIWENEIKKHPEMTKKKLKLLIDECKLSNERLVSNSKDWNL